MFQIQENKVTILETEISAISIWISFSRRSVNTLRWIDEQFSSGVKDLLWFKVNRKENEKGYLPSPSHHGLDFVSEQNQKWITKPK